MDKPSLNDSAIEVHEMYLSFIRAGFTETQALELLKAMLTKGSRNDG